LSNEGKEWLKSKFPNITNYINLDEGFITQDNIEKFINANPDINEKLNLYKYNTETYNPTRIDKNLGDQLLTLDGFQEKFDNLSDGTFSDKILSPNQENFETHPDGLLMVDDYRWDEIFNLLLNNNVFVNPYQNIFDRIYSLNNKLKNILDECYNEENTNIQLIISEFNDVIETFDAFKQHTDLLSDVNQQSLSSITIDTNKSPNELASLINTAQQPIISFAQQAIAVAENMSSIYSTLASGKVGDGDGRGNQKFNPAPLRTIMGSVIEKTLIKDLIEYVEDIETVLNQLTDFEIIKRTQDALDQKQYFEYNSKLAASSLKIEYYQLKTEYYAKKILFLNNKVKQYNGLSNKVEIKNSLENALFLPYIISNIRKLMSTTIQSELGNYNYYKKIIEKFGKIQPTDQTMPWLQSVASVELNKAMRKTSSDPNNYVSEETMNYESKKSEFPEEYPHDSLVEVDYVTGKKEIRKMMRSVNGRIEVYNPHDICDNLISLAKNILIPLSKAGFNFEIISSRRAPERTEWLRSEYTESDHHYGLAVDIMLYERDKTDDCVVYIKNNLPYNRIILYNYNSVGNNNDAFIHISYYGGNDYPPYNKDDLTYPVYGKVERLGGDNIPIDGYDI
jgi:hypothetical protein